MKKTLISFIGIGRQKETDGKQCYIEAQYDFGGKIISASVFFNAIVQYGEFPIDKIILVGTKTSTWGTLLEPHLAKSEAYRTLYNTIEQEIKSGITQDTLNLLEKALFEIWNIKCKCFASDPEIKEQNAFTVISNYFDIIAEEVESDILLDITHGFRSMPVLLMCALQFREAFRKEFANIEIIYGEFGKPGEPGPVRYLQSIWDATKISQATNDFFSRFDPSKLSEEVKSFWPSGANAIWKLGNVIQCNLVLDLPGALQSVENALKDYNEEKSPKWSRNIVYHLRFIHYWLNSATTNQERLLRLARILFAQKFVGQAIITLRLSYEAFLFGYYEEEKFYGNFRKMKKLSGDFAKLLDSESKQKVKNLEYTRNMIAHGGPGEENTIEQLVDISQFENYSRFLTNLFEKYKKGQENGS